MKRPILETKTHAVPFCSYQFNPASAKEPVIVKILVKALTAIPAPDFNLCLYLLAEHSVSRI